MNQENWNALTTKLAESEQLELQVRQLKAALSQLRTEIEHLSTTLQDELAQLRTITPATTDEPSA